MAPDSQAEPERDPLDRNMAGLYASLRSMARRAVRGRTGKRILEPTELVHECYLKLAKSRSLGELSRTEFLALSASAIRSVLVDHARQLETLKHGGHHRRVTLDASVLVEREEVDLLGLDAALTKLARLDPRMARVVELRFFGGLEIEEVARTLGISTRTVDHDWSMAKAWLHRELASER